ncbi:hypothetical protein GCM10010124_38100 [Pilimelia terevasa]|uniref:Secreted protein n=1 Tax=Pilimelia terevasa TaxID=53372 RepID=A0A8J3FLE7_9ACTN|nr:DUF4360 domain-containing protein [Pilimelia terevasa]GGK41637.1 hypothetical protein GCM10010124_38100 [Pilimelia terevasa]
MRSRTRGILGTALVGIGVGALGLHAAPATAGAAAPLLTYVGASGTGCPEGSVAATPTPDGAGATVIYSKFDVRSTGPVVVQHCALRFTVAAAPGTRATTLAVQHRGGAVVPAGGHAGVTTSYEWGGGDGGFQNSWTKEGAYSGPWQLDDTLPADGAARCGGTTELVLRVFAHVRGADGLVQPETADGRLTGALRAGAQRC